MRHAINPTASTAFLLWARYKNNTMQSRRALAASAASRRASPLRHENQSTEPIHSRRSAHYVLKDPECIRQASCPLSTDSIDFPQRTTNGRPIHDHHCSITITKIITT